MPCVSPLAKGLFQAAISQSGGSFGSRRRNEIPRRESETPCRGRALRRSLARNAGASTIAELRKCRRSTAGRPRAGVAYYRWPRDPHDHTSCTKPSVTMTSRSWSATTPTKAQVQSAENGGGLHHGLKARYGRCRASYEGLLNRCRRRAENCARSHSRCRVGWHTWIWARLQAKTGKSKVFDHYFTSTPIIRSFTARRRWRFAWRRRALRVRTSQPIEPQIMKAGWRFRKRWPPIGEFCEARRSQWRGMPPWPAFSDSHPEVMYFGRVPTPGRFPVRGQKALDAYFAWRRTPEGRNGCEEAKCIRLQPCSNGRPSTSAAAEATARHSGAARRSFPSDSKRHAQQTSAFLFFRCSYAERILINMCAAVRGLTRVAENPGAAGNRGEGNRHPRRHRKTERAFRNLELQKHPIEAGLESDPARLRFCGGKAGGSGAGSRRPPPIVPEQAPSMMMRRRQHGQRVARHAQASAIRA